MNRGLIRGDQPSPLVDPPRDPKRDEEVKEMRGDEAAIRVGSQDKGQALGTKMETVEAQVGSPSQCLTITFVIDIKYVKGFFF